MRAAATRACGLRARNTARRRLTRSRWVSILRSTATTFYILIGAFVFTPFVALSGIPTELVDVLTSLGANRYVILLVALAFLIFLGTFLEGIAMMVLKIPIEQRPEGGAIGCTQRRRSGGGRCPGVRDKIGDGRIGLMTYPCDDRDRASSDRFRDDLGVECPEVFDRPTAAGDEDDIDVARLRHARNRRGNLRGRLFPLHPGRRDQNRNRGKTTPSHLEDVSHRGARGRCHDADTTRMSRNRKLLFLIEEAGCVEPAPELLEGELQRAHATGFERANDQLQIAPRGVDRNLGFGDDLEPLLQLETDISRVAAKERGAHLTLFVFEREVAVSRSRAVEIADFADDPDATDMMRDQPRQPCDELTDAENRTPVRVAQRASISAAATAPSSSTTGFDFS